MKIMTVERTPTIHKRDMVLNKKKLKSILDSKGMSYKELWETISDRYGLDLTYKGFMSLVSNRVTWKLLYAYAIIDALRISYLDIFEIVEIDIDKRIKEKKEWKKQYQDNGNNVNKK
jgi:hypothetical protein